MACLGLGTLGCGSGEGGDAHTESARALAFATHVSDLSPRLAALAGRVAEASNPGDRARLRDQIEVLQGDASALAGAVDAELSGDLRDQLFTAADCYENPTEELKTASVNGSGREAAAATQKAHSEFGSCGKALRTALLTLRDEYRQRIGALLTRGQTRSRRAELALARLAAALESGQPAEAQQPAPEQTPTTTTTGPAQRP